MTQTQNTPGAGQSGSFSIDQIQETTMNIVYTVSSIVTLPIEMGLRPKFGSTYFSAPIFFLSAIMLILASAFFGIAVGVGQMIPFANIRGPVGTVGMGSLTGLFFIASLIHGIRVWRLMVNMHLETYSRDEGPALPFFAMLPKGTSHWFVRLVWEPVFVYALAYLLEAFAIIQFPVMLYLQIGSLFLAMKSYVAFYQNWAHMRHLIDAANIGPIISRIVSNTATEEEKAKVHMATLPNDLPPSIRKATIAHIARSFGTPVDEPPIQRNSEAGFAMPKLLFLILVIAVFCFLTMGGLKHVQQIVRPVDASPQRQATPAPAQSSSAPRHSGDLDHGPHAFIFPMPPAAPPPPPIFAGTDEDLAAFEKRVGAWEAKSVILDRGDCTLRVELQQDKPGAPNFTAYTTQACAPLPLWQAQNRSKEDIMKQMLGGLSPKSAKLSGSLVKNTIELKVEDTVNNSGDGCAMKSLSLSAWASGAMAAKWDDAPCKGGQLILARAKH